MWTSRSTLSLQRWYHDLAGDVDGRAGGRQGRWPFCVAHGGQLHDVIGLDRLGGPDRCRLCAHRRRHGPRPPGLLSLKRGLRERLQACPAWDIDRYTLDFEGALRQMWLAYCGSEKKDDTDNGAAPKKKKA